MHTTPWPTPAHLQELVSLLHTSPLSTLPTLQSYLTRGNTPFSILSTYTLLQTLQLDSKSTLTTHHLRLLYTISLIRFLNGFVDPLQKSLFNRSVKSLASTIGLQEFVDLRHEGTHGDLPTLSECREKCKDGVQWLIENYWDSQKW